jgi:hypothetical protein
LVRLCVSVQQGLMCFEDDSTETREKVAITLFGIFSMCIIFISDSGLYTQTLSHLKPRYPAVHTLQMRSRYCRSV